MRASLPRRVVREMLERKSLSGLRQFLMWREALAEHRFVLAISHNANVPSLEMDWVLDNIAPKPKKVWYVLGSGSSVEDLTQAAFGHISREVSVGINAWALHDFVPDFYCFEPVPERSSDHYSTMKLLHRESVLAKKPGVFFLKPRSPVELEQLRMIPPEILSKTVLYGRFQPYTRLKQNLVDDWSLLSMLASRKLSVLPDSGASVFRMAALGILLGFPKVVLVGVDLNHTEYFWEKNPKYLEMLGLSGFESGQKGSVHETVSSHNRAFGIVDMLMSLATVAPQFGSALEVASPQSLLASSLPIHTFGNIQQS